MYKIIVTSKVDDTEVIVLQTDKRSLAKAAHQLFKDNGYGCQVVTEIPASTREVKFKEQ